MLNPIYHRFINVLQSIIPLPDEQIGKLSAIFRPSSLSAGQFFIQARERPTQIRFVVSELMRLCYVNSAGAEFNKAFCPENHFVAAHSAVTEQKILRNLQIGSTSS